MAKTITRKAAAELLEAGYIDQATHDKMFDDGIVSSGAGRSSRPEVNIPAEHKNEFLDKAYDAIEAVGKELAETHGFDISKATPDGGTATLYMKGSGSPRKSKDETEDNKEDEKASDLTS